MRRYGSSCIQNERKVGLAMIIQWSWNANQNSLDFVKSRGVCRCFETISIYLFSNAFRRKMFEVGFARVNGIHFLMIEIKPEYGKSRTGKLEGQGKPHVTKAHY